MLQVTALTKRYGKNTTVNGLTFAVGEGEIIGLLGPNGAGKSTTMKMITNILAPTSGEITFLGENVAEMGARAKKNIGYLPEIPPLYLDLTVTEHLHFVAELQQIAKGDIPAEIDRVIAALKLEEMRHRLIGNLSKGYKQRVGIAAAIIGRPKFLILDEPTVGLDPQQMIDIRNLILDLSSSMSVLISSHILSEIAEICTRVIIMRKGNLIADGTPAQLEAQYNAARTFRVVVQQSETAIAALQAVDGVSELTVEQGRGEELQLTLTSADQGDLRAPVFHALCQSGDILLSLTEEQRTLEDIFIELTQQSEVQHG